VVSGNKKRTCNGAFVANKIGPVVGGEVLVQHAVETPCLVLVPVDAILDVLGRVASEVVCEYQTLATTYTDVLLWPQEFAPHWGSRIVAIRQVLLCS
jgi:hypothetical protein